MTTFFVLLLVAAVIAFVLTKKSAQPAKFVINKKPEPVVEVTTTEVVETKKIRKPRAKTAKKITAKKKTNPPK